MIVQNAWSIYRQYKAPEDEDHDLLSFRREIVNAYFMKYKQQNVAVERTSSKVTGNKVPIDVQFIGYYHYQDDTGRNRRCAVCKRSTLRGCRKCVQGLHDRCFKEFHGYE